LPTDDPEAAVAEIVRATADLNPDGWALSTTYNHVNLSNPALEPVWSQLDHRHATVFIHPDTTGPPQLGLPNPGSAPARASPVMRSVDN
jgi:predicted TIM-barrel fold metal-dependent hydrolase